ncbi:MAG: sterol carrier protein domain-containing protein [Dehalococcoidia bacterium]|nr:sterol carrier protein domain-containing protein [Dehalococcoidia bacterium]
MLEDPRRLTRRYHDALWIRVLNVPRALSARRYSAADRLVFEVADPFLGAASGRFALEADKGGALCVPTSEEPDVRLGVAELGALYMGSFSLQPFVATGRARVATPETVQRVDAMFRWPVATWCPEVF